MSPITGDITGDNGYAHRRHSKSPFPAIHAAPISPAQWFACYSDIYTHTAPMTVIGWSCELGKGGSAGNCSVTRRFQGIICLFMLPS